jgi:hypothetical protein
MTTMADRMTAARQSGFVGRQDELALFRELLRETEPTVGVLFVHGPGGVGKSSLLRRFADLAVGAGAECLLLDARDVPPVPAAIEPLVLRFSAAPADRHVLLIDTYEQLQEYEGWMRGQLLPRLPADTLVVIAGQHPPAPAWRTDPGWSELVRSVRLDNLTPAESRQFLARRQLDHAAEDRVVDFTHGHPLALALVCEVLGNSGTFRPHDDSDVIGTLVERFLQVVPSPAHRLAVEAAAQVRVTTEPLLAALLARDDAGELFDWLRRLPFVDVGPAGLHLHDLARDVLAAELRWRNTPLFQQLHERAREHYLSRLVKSDAAGQAAVLLDLMYLHADLRQFLQPADANAELRVDTATPADHAAILGMIGVHEGPGSAALADYWLIRQPEAWLVVRDEAGHADGVLCLLAIQDATDDERNRDPAVAAAHRQLTLQPPLRPGERCTLIRFWMARASYQELSPVQSLIAVQLARHYLTTPQLAVSLLPFAEPERWVEFCSYADQSRLAAADFAVDGRTYGVYGHDWRLVPPVSLLARLSVRQAGAEPEPVAPVAGARVLVLDETAFTAAVRRALRDMTRQDRLRSNPLLTSRLVRSRVGENATPGELVAALQAAIREAAAILQATPADAKLFRVLNRAYLSPAPTLERAAELLDLPSSTFRRHLTAATARVVTLLWHQELQR